jgi:hypothetical protein
MAAGGCLENQKVNVTRPNLAAFLEVLTPCEEGAGETCGAQSRGAVLSCLRDIGKEPMASTPARIPWWAWTWPLVACIVLVLQLVLGSGGPLDAAEAFALIATVFAAVYHAEVIASRVGEPFGTLVLAVAVTIIEVALIVSMMITGGPEKAVLARDTVFAAVMIVCNGIVGLCLLAGGCAIASKRFSSKEQTRHWLC